MTLTKRQWLAQELVKDANAMPGKVADFFLYGGNLDRVAVLAQTPALATVVQFVAAKSNLQRGGTFTSSGLANAPVGYNGIEFESPPISSVDRIVIETGAGELTFNIPLLPGLNAATLDPLAPQFPRDQPVGVAAVGPASDRQLVVYEANPTNPDAGRLIAIPPGDASGVSVPTFNVSPVLPTAGGVRGDSVYVTTVRRGYIWDGARWNDITSPDWVALTQTQYNALTPPLPGTLYVITGP
jgi:hypothetical protein